MTTARSNTLPLKHIRKSSSGTSVSAMIRQPSSFLGDGVIWEASPARASSSLTGSFFLFITVSFYYLNFVRHSLPLARSAQRYEYHSNQPRKQCHYNDTFERTHFGIGTNVTRGLISAGDVTKEPSPCYIEDLQSADGSCLSSDSGLSRIMTFPEKPKIFT